MIKQRNMNVGAAILFVIFCLLFFVLLFRFIQIQVTGEAGGQVLAAKAEQKYKKKQAIEASRGSILDRNGDVIAEDTVSYKLVAILDPEMTTNKKKPRHVVDAKMTARKLAEFIDMSESEIYEILTRKKKQVEFGQAGREISNQMKVQMEELQLPGITFIRETKRFYPNGIFASHLIGYAEREETENGQSETVGKLGLEKSLDTYLQGKNGSFTYKSDSYGLLLPNSEPKIVPAEHGKDIYLTIDKKIQTFLEDAMDKAAEEYTPNKLLAIVADPKTGEILAMSQRPTFHPKTRDGLEQSWHNEIIETSYEPGSTMKVFTLAAAIEEGVFNPNELFKSGAYKVGADTIRDHNVVGWGSIPFLEGVQRSSNVAFSILAMDKLGPETFRTYLSKFGLDRKTGINLPNETSGKILFNYPIEKVTTSYGQGSVITPIQQIQAMTAIANDGKMMKPQIIKQIVNQDNGDIVKKKEPEVVAHPVSAETAKQVRDILETVVSSPKGTGNQYQIKGYEVAGKTGTAQIPGPNGHYLTGRENYIFSFLGAVPKDDPELIMYVAVQQPKLKNDERGSDPIATIFKTVMKHSLQYLNIKPSELKETKVMNMPNVIDMRIDQAVTAIEKEGLEPIVIGKGKKVVEQQPFAKTKLLEGEKVILKSDGELTIPNMKGWSLRDVMKVAQLADLELNTIGNGYVKKQNVSAGSTIAPKDYLVVELESPLDSEVNRKDSANKEAPDQLVDE